MIKVKGGSITKARLSNTLLGKELYRAGLTQEAFAEKVGISARYVRVLCTRDVNVSIAVYYEILKVFQQERGKNMTIRKNVLPQPFISQASHSSLV